jgi:RES domain-containing protein
MWVGQVFRVMLHDYPPDRENTQGARWNPPDVAAIYACREPAVCIAEVEYGLARQSRPVRPDLRKTLHQIDVQLSTAVDLVPILDSMGFSSRRRAAKVATS